MSRSVFMSDLNVSRKMITMVTRLTYIIWNPMGIMLVSIMLR